MSVRSPRADRRPLADTMWRTCLLLGVGLLAASCAADGGERADDRAEDEVEESAASTPSSTATNPTTTTTSLPGDVTMDQVLSSTLTGEHCDGSVDPQLTGGRPNGTAGVGLEVMASGADGAPLVALGDVDGDGIGDGVFWSSCSLGGSTALWQLHVLLAGATTTEVVPFGDGVASESEFVAHDVSIDEREIVARYWAAEPGEAHCCATTAVTETIRRGGDGYERRAVDRFSGLDAGNAVAAAADRNDHGAVQHLVDPGLFAQVVQRQEGYGELDSCEHFRLGEEPHRVECWIGTTAGWTFVIELESIGFRAWAVTSVFDIGGGM